MKAIKLAFASTPINYGILLATIGGNGAAALVTRIALKPAKAPREAKREEKKDTAPAAQAPADIASGLPVLNFDDLIPPVPLIGRLSPSGDEPGFPQSPQWTLGDFPIEPEVRNTDLKSLLMTLERMLAEQFSETKDNQLTLFINQLENKYASAELKYPTLFPQIFQELSMNEGFQNKNAVIIVKNVPELECNMFQLDARIPISAETKFYLLHYDNLAKIWQWLPHTSVSMSQLPSLFSTEVHCSPKTMQSLIEKIPSVWDHKLVSKRGPMQKIQFLLWTVADLSLIPLGLCKSLSNLYEGVNENKTTLNPLGQELRTILLNWLSVRLPKRGRLTKREKCWQDLAKILNKIS
jgi:hypothetical protein